MTDGRRRNEHRAPTEGGSAAAPIGDCALAWGCKAAEAGEGMWNDTLRSAGPKGTPCAQSDRGKAATRRADGNGLHRWIEPVGAILPMGGVFSNSACTEKH